MEALGVNPGSAIAKVWVVTMNLKVSMANDSEDLFFACVCRAECWLQLCSFSTHLKAPLSGTGHFPQICWKPPKTSAWICVLHV